MALVKDAGHMIRLDDCFDPSPHRANYEKVKKYMRTYPTFMRGVAGSIPERGTSVVIGWGSIPKRLDERSWDNL